MNVIPIQTSGTSLTTADPAYLKNAKGPRYCDEPLSHRRYFNAEPYWEQGFLRRRPWQSARNELSREKVPGLNLLTVPKSIRASSMNAFTLS